MLLLHFSKASEATTIQLQASGVTVCTWDVPDNTIPCNKYRFQLIIPLPRYSWRELSWRLVLTVRHWWTSLLRPKSHKSRAERCRNWNTILPPPLLSQVPLGNLRLGLRHQNAQSKVSAIIYSMQSSHLAVFFKHTPAKMWFWMVHSIHHLSHPWMTSTVAASTWSFRIGLLNRPRNGKWCVVVT